MTSVQIAKQDNKLIAKSPYHPNLPPAAKKLGGKWDGTAWVFDARDEDRVRETYINIYGTDGETGAGSLVTVRVTFVGTFSAHQGAVYMCGRLVARAYNRDSGAKIGDGIVFTVGAPESGGSVKNWKTVIPKGSVVEIRDVPRPAAENFISKIESGEIGSEYNAEIIDETLDRDALKSEREKLMARIAEIDKLLNQ